MPSAAPILTLVGNMQDVLGEPGTGAQLKIFLAGFGGSVPVAFGSVVLTDITKTITADANGTINEPIWGNDTIQPAGTFYCFQYKDASGNIVYAENYRLLGAGNVDIALLVPYNPGSPVIPGLIVYVPWAAAAGFDASLGSVFEMTMLGNVSPALQNFMPGNTYVFIFLQDSAGNRVVTWPSSVKNAADVNPAANAITIQKFVVLADNLLYPLSPAIYL